MNHSHMSAHGEPVWLFVAASCLILWERDVPSGCELWPPSQKAGALRGCDPLSLAEARYSAICCSLGSCCMKLWNSIYVRDLRDTCQTKNKQATKMGQLSSSGSSQRAVVHNLTVVVLNGGPTLTWYWTPYSPNNKLQQCQPACGYSNSHFIRNINFIVRFHKYEVDSAKRMGLPWEHIPTNRITSYVRYSWCSSALPVEIAASGCSCDSCKYLLLES